MSIVTDAVKREADSDDQALSGRSTDFEWIDLDVPADTWWDVVDHPKIAGRSLDGWKFHSCTPSSHDEDQVVLTYYRPLKLPVMHHTGLRGRTAWRGRSGRGLCG